MGCRALCRRGGRGAGQDLDLEGHAAASGVVCRNSSHCAGARGTARARAREMLHRQFGEERSACRAEDRVSNLLVEKKEGVAWITLNRPEVRNAFDDALISQLSTAFKNIQADQSVRVVVLAGNGPAFCAGADLNWMKRMASYGYEENLADARALADMLAALDRLPKPTIARVHGPAFAGGTGLVAACDLAIGTPQAKFCLPEAKLGLSPATISPYVMRAIGERAARRYFRSAEAFDAAKACRIGLLSACVSSNALDSSVEEIIKHLLAGGSEAHAKIKELIRAVAGRAVDAALVADTARRIAEIRVSPEGREGIASFLEKRKPSWGRGKN